LEKALTDAKVRFRTLMVDAAPHLFGAAIETARPLLDPCVAIVLTAQ